MNQITNLNVYLSRMDAALLDKCWWIDKIPSSINTIIDFGCASGRLKAMIDLLAPNTYKYIGVDNSPEMRTECAKKGIRAYTSLYEAAARVKPEHTILILNSVIHEILSYDDVYMTLFNEMASYKFAYVAIRDMNLSDEIIGNPDLIPLMDTILNSKYGNQWLEFKWIAERRWGVYHAPEVYTREFLMKYWYTENWNRECKEQYLWDWKHLIISAFNKYSTEYENDFYIPYIRNKVKQDFNYDFDIHTHKKLLLTNIKYLH